MTTQRTNSPFGGIDSNALLQILVAQLARELPNILALLFAKMNDKDEKPTTPSPVDIVPILPPGADDDEDRAPTRLETKVFWISRKRTPYKAGGGRDLISDAGKQRVISGADPLQAGDRVCFDVSPYDQNDVKYEGQKPLVLEHHVGGVGELQQQEENDYTPVVLVPWEDEQIRPGFEGEISYFATGGELTSNTISLRVKPWGA